MNIEIGEAGCGGVGAWRVWGKGRHVERGSAWNVGTTANKLATPNQGLCYLSREMVLKNYSVYFW